MSNNCYYEGAVAVESDKVQYTEDYILADYTYVSRSF